MLLDAAQNQRSYVKRQGKFVSWLKRQSAKRERAASTPEAAFGQRRRRDGLDARE